MALTDHSSIQSTLIQGANQKKRDRLATPDELGQVLLLLRGVAIAHNLVDAQVGVGAVAQGNGAASPRELLHNNGMVEVAHLRATVLGRGRDAQQAHVAQLAPELAQLSEVVVPDGQEGGRKVVNRLANTRRGKDEKRREKRLQKSFTRRKSNCC